MHSDYWHLQQQTARLQAAQLAAAVDLQRPERGLGHVCVNAYSLPDARLLAIASASCSSGAGATVVDQYVRGADLAIAYEESAAGPMRVDALWRASLPRGPQRFVAAVQLIVSVRTQRLESRPDLAIETSVPATEAWQLVDATSHEFRALDVPNEAPVVLEPDRGRGCLLLRLPGSDLSYAEMVHPADFQRDELRGSASALFRDDTARGEMHVSHRLFACPLEKGVILRARVRGVFLPRGDDRLLAAQCFAAFAAEDLPLGT